jgi:hypothetical protein
VAAVLLAAATALAQDDVDGWLAELRRKNDDADPALIEKVADAKTKAAAEGLLRLYDSMSSAYMQREIVRALAKFDGVAGADTLVLDKLANVAGSAEEPELREAALAGIIASSRGHAVLKKLVDSDAPESVREPAMKAHVKQAMAEDAAWYRYVWNVKGERRKNPDKTIQALEQNTIRLLAFQGLAQGLGEEELVDALKSPLEGDPKIKRAILQTMKDRKMPKTAEMAGWVLERVDMPGANRAEAARVLIDLEGVKAVNTFLELAKKRDVTSDDLREEMARLIGKLNDDATNKRVKGLIGKGKPHERVFAMMCNAANADPKVGEAIRKELGDKEAEVRKGACQVLGQRRDKAALPDLHKLLAQPKAPEDRRLAIEAISAIEQGSAAWLSELESTWAVHADRDVRNAALEQLAATKDVKYLPLFGAALEHADWSTRFVAIDALVTLRDKQGVPKLIARLKEERGRLAKAVAEALWKLTGQPFEEDYPKWQGWWASEGDKFTVITPADLEKAEKERELRRLKQRTRTGAKFFGIKVESHRVIFILDTSGSMLESVYGRYVGKHGAARIDVAKQELTQAIKNMDADAMFNVFTFSSGVTKWADKIATNNEETRKQALVWIDRLGASGGTDLYDAVKQAFEDKEVDTIFIMSDGEPTNGEIIEPSRIREQIAFLNKHRHVKINTIAVGGTFEILEWLAQDAGGSHVRIR